MNTAAIWGAVTVVVIIVIGLLAWQAVGPDLAVSPTPVFQPVGVLPTTQPAAVPVFPGTTSLAVSPSPTAPALTTSPTAAATADATVSMNDTGFAPSSVRVAAGSAVTFVNNGQAAHWPASDVHPTHQLLPGFDAKRGLSTGETYSFTFTQKGAWACHDHLNPQFKCTVVVE